ncbi:DUF417 family protein [Pedobacter sp. Bi126]|uniref:DUF417 family protein n=1 Tax=unclassified Pedobacter TaxID=2628915 RepID=UPI003530359E
MGTLDNDQDWGFSYLSGRGRLVLKDILILGEAIIKMSESAKLYLSLRWAHNKPLLVNFPTKA